MCISPTYFKKTIKRGSDPNKSVVVLFTTERNVRRSTGVLK